MCKGNDFSPNEQRFFPKCEAQASEKALFNISPTLSPLNPPVRCTTNSQAFPSSFPLPLPFLSLFVPFFIPRFYRGRPFPSSSVPNTNFQSSECNLQTQLASVQTQLASIQMQLASLRTQPASELPTYPNRTISHAPAGFPPAFRHKNVPVRFFKGNH